MVRANKGGSNWVIIVVKIGIIFIQKVNVFFIFHFLILILKTRVEGDGGAARFGSKKPRYLFIYLV